MPLSSITSEFQCYDPMLQKLDPALMFQKFDPAKLAELALISSNTAIIHPHTGKAGIWKCFVIFVVINRYSQHIT